MIRPGDRDIALVMAAIIHGSRLQAVETVLARHLLAQNKPVPLPDIRETSGQVAIIIDVVDHHISPRAMGEIRKKKEAARRR